MKKFWLVLLLALSLLFLFFLSGCVQTEVVTKYVCSDGTIVSLPEQCPVTALARAFCHERQCRALSRIYCLGTTKALESYTCDANTCVVDVNYFENDVACGYTCNTLECDKEDFFVCDGFTKISTDFSCTADQECLPTKLVDVNSVDCGWIHPKAPKDLNTPVYLEGVEVNVLQAEKKEELTYYNPLESQQFYARAPQGYYFVLIEVKVLNVIQDNFFVNKNKFRVSDDLNRSYYLKEYNGVDRLQNVWLNPETKVSGKLLFNLPRNENVYFVEYVFDKERDLMAKWKIDLSKIKLT